MKQEIKNKVYISLEGEILITINADSPDLSEVIEKIILDLSIDVDKITCESDIENFDKEGFLTIIVETSKEIRELIQTNEDDIKSILDSEEQDESAIEYYKKLNEENEK